MNIKKLNEELIKILNENEDTVRDALKLNKNEYIKVGDIVQIINIEDIKPNILQGMPKKYFKDKPLVVISDDNGTLVVAIKDRFKGTIPLWKDTSGLYTAETDRGNLKKVDVPNRQDYIDDMIDCGVDLLKN